MRIARIIFFVLLQAAVLLTACGKNNPPSPEPSIKILADTRTSEKTDGNGGSFSISFESAESWNISIEDESWVSVSPMSGPSGSHSITITVKATTLTEERSCEVTIMSGNVGETIVVLQKNRYAPHLYKVVSHRGGYMENGFPESSLAGLKYSIAQNCYACETDVFITADDSVLCVHSNHETDFNLYNNMEIATHTLAEVRATGTLSNGEQLPSFEDFLKIISDPKQNPLGTKLWLDVKGRNASLQLEVIYRCAEIAKEMNATQYVEMLISQWLPQYSSIRDELMTKYGIACAWNYNGSVAAPLAFGEGGWAQLRYTDLKSSQYWPPSNYYNAVPPVVISVYYTVSSVSKYNDFYLDIFPYYKKMKAIFTNYPKHCIDALIERGYDEPSK